MKSHALMKSANKKVCTLALFTWVSLRNVFYYNFENELSCTRNVKINKMITTVLALCFILNDFNFNYCKK